MVGSDCLYHLFDVGDPDPISAATNMDISDAGGLDPWRHHRSADGYPHDVASTRLSMLLATVFVDPMELMLSDGSAAQL